MVVEKLDGRAEQEAALCLASGGDLGDRLGKPAAKVCDLVLRAFQRGPGHLGRRRRGGQAVAS